MNLFANFFNTNTFVFLINSGKFSNLCSTHSVRGFICRTSMNFKTDCKLYSLYKILELNNGDICFSTSGRGVYKISPDNLSQPEKMSKVTEQMEIEVCRTILEDRNGTIWVGTPIGVSIYDPATMRLTHFKRDIINRDITQCVT